MALIKPNPPALRRGHPLNRGLVGAWLFTEGAGARVNDASGYGNHGTAVAAPVWTGNSFGPGLTLNGTTQYITTPTNGINTSNRAPFSVFLRNVQPAPPPSAYGRIISLETGANVGFAILAGPVGDEQWYFGNAGGQTSLAYSTSPASILMVYDGSTIFVYINGIFRTSVAGTTDTGQAALLSIGTYPVTPPSEPWPGTLNEVRFYNRALSAFEAYQLYQSDYSEFLAPRRAVVAGGESAALDGAAGLTFTPAAVLKGAASLPGTSALTLAAAADVRAAAKLLGIANLAFAPVGNLRGAAALSASASLAVSPAGSLKGVAGLSAPAALAFTPLAALGGAAAASGSAGLALSISAATAVTATLAGASALAFSQVANLTALADTGFDGTISLAITAAGTLSGNASLNGAADLAFSLSGDVLGNSTALAASASVSFAPSASLSAPMALASAGGLTFSPAATLLGATPLAGVSVLTFGGVGDFTPVVPATMGAAFTRALAMAISLAYHGIPSIHGRIVLPLFAGGGFGGSGGSTLPPGPTPAPPPPTVSLTPGYQYAPVAAPIGPGLTPSMSAWALRLVDAVNNTQRGKMNVTLTLTLAANEDSTLVIDSRISAFSALTLMPLTASAAAEQAAGTLYFSSQKSGEAVLQHANSAVADREFRLSILA